MIQASELRIGNYVAYTPITSGIRLPVNSDFEHDKFFIHAIGYPSAECCWIKKNPAMEKELPSFKYIELAPIPPSEYWLFRLGAYMNMAPNGYPYFSFPNLLNHRFTLDNGRANLRFEYCENDEVVWAPIIAEYDSIHSIQNVHFALTGQELTINNQK